MHNCLISRENKIYPGRGGNSKEGTDGMLHIHPTRLSPNVDSSHILGTGDLQSTVWEMLGLTCYYSIGAKAKNVFFPIALILLLF